MTITFTDVRQTSDRSWVFTWADTGADVYRVVLFGVLVGTTSRLTWVWDGNGFLNSPPPLEVVEDGELALSELYPPYLAVQWYQEPGAESYTVEEYRSSSWAEVASIDEQGTWVYSYVTQTLTDGYLEKLRVTAYDDLGNPSAPEGFTMTVLTAPPVPSVTVSYSGGNAVIGGT